MADRFSIAGQQALVIGGTSGIGLELARAFLDAGAKVIVAGSTQERLGRALAELKPRGEAFGYRADVRDLEALHGLIGVTLAHHGHLDLLVNCQGITRMKPAEEFSREDWSAIISLTRTFAAEWATRGVRVNAITPGFFMTELASSAMNPVRRQRALERAPMARWGELDELVGAAIYLASPAARFVTGETIRVDGGFLAAGL